MNANQALKELQKYESVPRFKIYLKIIETALNRLPELEKENALLRENNHSLEELMKRPELVIVRENIQLKRDKDLLLINESSARQENKKLEEILKIIKEKCPHTFHIYISKDYEYFMKHYGTYDEEHADLEITEAEFNLLKEYFKGRRNE